MAVGNIIEMVKTPEEMEKEKGSYKKCNSHPWHCQPHFSFFASSCLHVRLQQGYPTLSFPHRKISQLLLECLFSRTCFKSMLLDFFELLSLQPQSLLR